MVLCHSNLYRWWYYGGWRNVRWPIEDVFLYVTYEWTSLFSFCDDDAYTRTLLFSLRQRPGKKKDDAVDVTSIDQSTYINQHKSVEIFVDVDCSINVC
jgi:hypothetical protein